MLARAGLGACPIGSLGWLSPDVCVQTPPWTYWAWSPGAGFGAQDSDRLFRGFGGPAQAPPPLIVQSPGRLISRELVWSRQFVPSSAWKLHLPQNMLTPSSVGVPQILKSTVKVPLQSFYFFNIYLFIWLCRVVMAACGIFMASCGIFCCKAQILWSTPHALQSA